VQQAFWLLTKVTPLALFDILLVTLIVYGLLMLIRGTQADQLVRGVLIVILASAAVGYFFNLTMFNWLLQAIIPALLFAIPVIFQPELRRALEQLGRTGNIINYPLHLHITTGVEKLAEELTRASGLLADRGYGALICVERSTGLEDLIQTGTRIDSIVASDLLLQIFFKGSPLHDGAVIIRGDRIVAARCLLPLTDDTDLDPELGTRHRAALGVTENTDAICVVVSEETGAISLANHGHLVRHLNEQKLKLLLTALLQTPSGLPTPMPDLSRASQEGETSPPVSGASGAGTDMPAKHKPGADQPPPVPMTVDGKHKAAPARDGTSRNGLVHDPLPEDAEPATKHQRNGSRRWNALRQNLGALGRRLTGGRRLTQSIRSGR
jgi:diadenylate cyclase